MLRFILLFLALILPFGVFGLDETRVNELECKSVSPPGDDVSVDADWMSSVKAFHIPVWSKIYAYRTAAELLEKDVSEISVEELETACLRFSSGNIVSGFGNTRTYNISGDGKSLTFKAPWDGAQAGHFVFHLTDNRNYVLGITCWDDQQSGWALLTSTETVDPEVKAQVLKYVDTLGFKGELALDSTYANCPAKQDDTASDPGSTDAIVLTGEPTPAQGNIIPANYVWYYPSHYNYIQQIPVAAQPYYYAQPGQFVQLPLGYH